MIFLKPRLTITRSWVQNGVYLMRGHTAKLDVELVFTSQPSFGKSFKPHHKSFNKFCKEFVYAG